MQSLIAKRVLICSENLAIKSSLRHMSRTSSACKTVDDKARTFLLSLGHESSVADGVLDALKASGVSSPSALLTTVRTLAGRIEVGEDAGLEALVEAVKLDLARTGGKKIIKFYVIPPTADESDERSAFLVKGYEGMSVTDVAKFGTLEGSSTLGEYIECACSGIMACSTCQMVVHKDWSNIVGEASEDEQDMIDLAFDPKPTSRLGCQIVLTSDMDGLILRVPRGANNIMDHIPFEG